MNTNRLMLVLVAAGVVATAVSAQSFNGGPINPGDNNTTGTPNNFSTVTVTGVPTLVNFNIEVDVTWAARHTFIGDVILRLTGPNAATVDLVNRPGLSTVLAEGHSSNFAAGPGSYSFRDSAPLRIIDVAGPLAGTDDSTGDVPFGFYRATSNTGTGDGTPTFSGEVAQTLNTSFGTVGNGDWRLTYTDNSAGDYAQVSGWVIRFVPVPEPTSVLAVTAGLVGLVSYGRRRFRREPVLA